MEEKVTISVKFLDFFGLYCMQLNIQLKKSNQTLTKKDLAPEKGPTCILF